MDYEVRSTNLKADRRVIEGLAGHGTSAVYEAQHRIGLLAASIAAMQDDVCIAGSAVTVRTGPGDTLMILCAIELLEDGDILVVQTDTDGDMAHFGDLMAHAAQARGCRGMVADACIRDRNDLRKMAFPVWATGVHARSGSRACGGTVNHPIVCGGTPVEPGDVVVADEDGVCIVARERASSVLEAANERAHAEATMRARLSGGSSALDVFNARQVLEDLAIRFERADARLPDD